MEGGGARRSLRSELKEGVVGVPRLLDLADRCGVVLRGWKVGQGGPRATGGESFQTRLSSPAVVFEHESGDVRAVVGDGGFGELAGAKAEPQRGSAGLGLRRSSMAAAELRALRGEATRVRG